MADSPLDLSRQITADMAGLSRAFKASEKEALRKVGAEARKRHLAHNKEAPGSDAKFSGTEKFNGGRLGVKVRYDDDVQEVRVSPQGPWALPAGKGKTTPGVKSWDKGHDETAAAADRIVGPTVDDAVQAVWRGR